MKNHNKHYNRQKNEWKGKQSNYKFKKNSQEQSFRINTALIFFDDKDATKYSRFIEHAEDWAKNSKRDSTNQIRNIYDEILQIDKADFNDIFKSLSLLKAKLVYAKSRDVIKEGFHENMKILIDYITPQETNKEKTESDFQRFLDFMEVFVAYHK